MKIFVILLLFSIKIRAVSILKVENPPLVIFGHCVSSLRISQGVANRLKTQKPLHTSQPRLYAHDDTAAVDTYYNVDYAVPIVAARVTMGPMLFVWGSSIMFDPWLHERVCLALMSQGCQLTSSPSSCKFNFKGLTRKFFHSRKIEIEARRSADREIAPGSSCQPSGSSRRP